ncbi:MAG: thiamine pyrophosphate-dependent enzyme [Trueperaceae bacterium]
MRSGGRLVVDTLVSEGVKALFTVPGESFLPVLDALFDPAEAIEVISTRHEEGAGFAAEAYAKASGEVGVCLVTRGVGVTNASIALHTAMQDATPMVIFVGQVPTGHKWREAFQEVDLPHFLGPIVKWAIEIPSSARVPELVQQAFRVARSGRPGPVVVGLPEDVLYGEAEASIPRSVRPLPPCASAEALGDVAKRLLAASKPVLLVGREMLNGGGHGALTALAERLGLPVMTAFRRFDAFPNGHPHYVGNVALGTPQEGLRPLAETDLLVYLGDRFDEISSNTYRYPLPGTETIHVAGDASIVGTWGDSCTAIVAEPIGFVRALLDELNDAQPNGAVLDSRRSRIAEYRGDYERLSAFEEPFPRSAEAVNLSAVMATVAHCSPEPTAVITDAGNFSAWVSRYYPFRLPGTHFAPISGAMGYAVPAAVGVAIADRSRHVVALAGDGGFAMTMNELAVLRKHSLKVVCVVFVNGLYGTIRMHQNKQFPGRPVGTELQNPSFSKIAEAFEIPAYSVSSNGDFDRAFGKALAHDGPSLIEVHEGSERLAAWGKPRTVAAEGTH